MKWNKCVCTSIQFRWRTFWAVVFSLWMLAKLEESYGEALFKWSISKDGIPNWQGKTSYEEERYWKALSWFGGGKEIGVMLLFSFLFAPREKFFYYLCAFTLDKLYVGYYKLSYADPRPYMADGNIHPITCSRAFGNPSGHSSAAQVFAWVIFLDVFHATHYNYKDNLPNISFYGGFIGWMWYLVSFALALFWSTAIPYSRWILGVHSLDQIIYGTLLGFWTVIVSHFVFRDNLLWHMKWIRENHEDAIRSDEDEEIYWALWGNVKISHKTYIDVAQEEKERKRAEKKARGFEGGAEEEREEE